MRGLGGEDRPVAQVSGGGHVIFDPAAQTVRPADSAGNVQGDLVVGAATGDLQGSADGVNRAQFLRVAAAIFKAYARNGAVPQTAHAYFG